MQTGRQAFRCRSHWPGQMAVVKTKEFSVIRCCCCLVHIGTTRPRYTQQLYLLHTYQITKDEAWEGWDRMKAVSARWGNANWFITGFLSYTWRTTSARHPKTDKKENKLCTQQTTVEWDNNEKSRKSCRVFPPMELDLICSSELYSEHFACPNSSPYPVRCTYVQTDAEWIKSNGAQ